MRIEELYLDGFGHFFQHSVGPLVGPMSVFYGPNEAGKTTLLAFVRAILFGFPARYGNHYPPLAGGRHGGRISLSDGAGALYVVERYAGARGGLKIDTPHGPASNPEAVLQRLTGNASQDLFRNVFAFSLDELQAAASLNDASGTIYSAGQGAPGLPALWKDLRDRKNLIYLSRGRGTDRAVPGLLGMLRDIDEQLRDIGGNAERYAQLTARRSGIEAELRDAEAGLTRLKAELDGIDRRLDGWNDWVAFSDCERRLRDTPRYVDFPDDPIPRLESLEERVRRTLDDRDEAAGQLRLASEAAAVEISGEELLDDRERVESIRRARSSFDNSVRDLPERKAELRGMEADFANNLTDLGHGWDETELLSFDASLPVRNQVDRWKLQVTECDERARQAQLQLDQECRALQDRQEETREARDMLPQEPPPLDDNALKEDQDQLRTARGRLAEYERRRQNLENLQGQKDALAASMETPEGARGRPHPPLLITLALAGILLLAAGMLLGGNSLFMGIVSGMVLLAAAAVLWYAGRSTPVSVRSPMTSAIRKRIADEGAASEAARQALLESAAALELAGQPDAAALDSVEAHLEADRDALDSWNAARVRVEDACRREKTQGKRVETAVQDQEEAKASSQEIQQKWRDWLGKRGLDQTLTPEAMATFLARVETTRSSLAEARRMRDRVAAIEKDILKFREQVEPLSRRHGLQLNPDDLGQLASVADELIGHFEDTQAAVSHREQARKLENELRQLLENRERRLQSEEKELAALLAAGGSDNPEEFRRRARQHEEGLKLERQRAEHRRALERISGPGIKFGAYCDSMATSDPNRLQEESARLSESMGEVENRCNGLREERGGIDTELMQLSGEEESSALRIRRSTLQEQLLEHAGEWSRLTLAEALLARTQKKFERERQPSVIRHAQASFSGITGGRYQRLYVPIGEQTITVTDDDGSDKQPDELSRGTREQLYLALRFGLIRVLGEHTERLPVVVDEALVNFDSERARLAAQAFSELAQTNQVLVFTCHRTIVDIFEKVGAQVVEIQRRDG